MSSVTLAPDTRVLHLPLDLQLERGGRLPEALLAYEVQGPPGAPVVVALGGISAGRDAAAWWQGTVGPGCAVDTGAFRVLGIDWLGGAGASTGPGPDDGELPFVSTGDQARAVALLLDHLGVEELHAWIGASYGGMVGLAFAAAFPGRLRRLLAIGAAHESHPAASAWRSVQRNLVRLGAATGRGAEAVALARGLAMVTYRSPDELEARFSAPPSWNGQRPRFPVEEYLEARGRAFAAVFPPAAFLCLSESIDAHRVLPERIHVPTALVSFSSDQLVPPGQVRELAGRLPALLSHVELPSLYGHDGFLKEHDALAPLIREVLS